MRTALDYCTAGSQLNMCNTKLQLYATVQNPPGVTVCIGAEGNMLPQLLGCSA